jgi:hypothetical protein
MSLNTIYDFDYEFSFDNNDITDTDNFDTIYNKCKIIDQSGKRKEIIYNKYLEILNLLLISPGFRIFSSFVSIDNIIYKVTIFNIQWSGSGLF